MSLKVTRSRVEVDNFVISWDENRRPTILKSLVQFPL